MEHKNISELTTEPKTLCIYIASAVWIVAEIDMFAFRVGLFSGIIGKACHMERAQQKMNMFWMCEKWERFQLTYIFCPNSFLNKWKVTCLKHNSVIFFFFLSYSLGEKKWDGHLDPPCCRELARWQEALSTETWMLIQLCHCSIFYKETYV